ncbi:sporulation protein Cse60 [Paenibacillus oenotherae]|uniref:Sporulation protein Cse60 n=1 Tax=Paenibacillus oenotherae TaxID=1435645 RepID=A0ABS7DA22_9BACL|nr:sporulation protein Cse60 [Paenibacillus oenotherae]
MIQIKEFIDSDIYYAEKKANEFLATISEEQFVDIRYGTMVKTNPQRTEYQRSTILVIYKTGS